jgi:hypothetical protein
MKHRGHPVLKTGGRALAALEGANAAATSVSVLRRAVVAHCEVKPLWRFQQIG